MATTMVGTNIILGGYIDMQYMRHYNLCVEQNQYPFTNAILPQLDCRNNAGFEFFKVVTKNLLS